MPKPPINKYDIKEIEKVANKVEKITLVKTGEAMGYGKGALEGFSERNYDIELRLKNKKK